MPRTAPGAHARLVDTTLREGDQACVRYLPPERVETLLEGLARAGVQEVEVGSVVADQTLDAGDVAGRIAWARAIDPNVRVAVWARARPEDIAAAGRLRPDVVSVAVPVSDLHLTARLHVSREWALAQPARITAQARAAGLATVSVGLEDATRADIEFVAQMARAAARAGVDRLRVADTVGVATPAIMADLVAVVHEEFPGEIGVHAHDDFGMATANTLTALHSGAEWADVSLLGLGERAGIARTEEVAGWLTLREGAWFDLPLLARMCRDLAGWVGQPRPLRDPIVGEQIFACESGIHLAGLAADTRCYEPYPPESVGARRTWRLGRRAGRGAVRLLAGARPGPRPDDPGDEAWLTEAVAEVRRRAREHGAAIDADDLPDPGPPRLQPVELRPAECQSVEGSLPAPLPAPLTAS